MERRTTRIFFYEKTSSRPGTKSFITFGRILVRTPRDYGNKGTCRFCKWEHRSMSNFSRELEIKMNSGEQFGISFKGKVKKTLLGIREIL